MSEGNGHPYSWSAIFNGFDKDEMSKCPFPIIPDYLSEQKFPDNYLSELGEVTHIWTQDLGISSSVAKASRISCICDRPEEMIGSIDALLLARDDAENHYKHAYPFLKAGIPVYIDKPFALSIEDAHKLWDTCLYPNQIFSCSALQFAHEFNLRKIEGIGKVKYIWATIPKSWEKYAVHIIEPVLQLIPNRGEIVNFTQLTPKDEALNGLTVTWSSGISAQFQTTGIFPSPLAIRVLGTDGYKNLSFNDTYDAFKRALEAFVRFVHQEDLGIPREFTSEMVNILENGKA